MKWNFKQISGYLLFLLFLFLLIISLDLKLSDFTKIKFTHTIWQDILISFFRVFLASITAWGLAVITGYLIYRNDFMKHLFMPLINFVRHISPFAWLPLAIIWFGLGEAPVAFIMFISLFFPSVVASAAQFESIPLEYMDEAHVLGANIWQTFRYVEFPLSLFALLNLYRIIWGLGWSVIIAAEMLGVQSGMGFRLLDFRYLLKYPEMLLYLVLMGIIGILFDSFLNKVIKRTVL